MPNTTANNDTGATPVRNQSSTNTGGVDAARLARELQQRGGTASTTNVKPPTQKRPKGPTPTGGN
ncbi:hypothetical protein N7462_004655 [Penicillium macrosclerotiorum]|uniref:uncharacterized protein n=1 Tax=Penicillium macrosclerotiorum TaxID=303699 RepID=UPI0025471FD9|nr:uncharacterized protein N7462_004655 [Penicillium macrosclerotiorum]KAJ5690263.1 hypothetical protein N7462_004655 [Penicillium macrosclerotiorum]